MKNYYSAWDRIEAIIKHYGFASVSALARELGLNRSENFSLFRILRIIDEQHILLTSLQFDKYDDLKLSREDIIQLYLLIR